MQEELLAEGSERAGDVSIREEEAAGKISFKEKEGSRTLLSKEKVSFLGE